MGLAVLLLVPLMLVAGLNPARAAALGPGVTIYPSGYGAVHLGPYETPAGVDDSVGYCVQARIYPPSGSDTIASTSVFSDPVLAYVYSQHRYATDDATAAAVAYETHMRGEIPGSMAGGNVGTVRSLIAAATPQFVKDRAAQLVAEAEGLAGPLQAASPASASGSGTRTGVIAIHPLVGRGGVPLVGYPMTFTLNGPATLDATGTKTWTGTSRAETFYLSWTAEPGANGAVTGSYRYSNLPRQTLTYVHPSGQRQAQLTYGLRAPSDPEELILPGPTFRAVGDFRPQGVSSAPAFVDVGEELVDTFVPQAHPEDEWVHVDGRPVPVTYSYDVYDVGSTPIPESNTAPSGRPVFSGTAVATGGPGVPITVSAGLASEPITYVYVWGSSKQLQPAVSREYVKDVVWTDGTKFAETTVVRAPLEHFSQMREYNVELGGRAFDEVTISGFPDDYGEFDGIGPFGPDGEFADFTVYGPKTDGYFTEPEVPEGTPVLMSTTLPARNGTYEVGYGEDDHIVPNQAGCYVAIYSYAGSTRVAPFSSRADDVREQFCVRDDPSMWLDMMSTASQSARAGVGEIADTVMIMGPAFPTEGATLTWEQCTWVPGDEPGCENPVVTHTVDVPRTGAYIHPDLATPSIHDFPPGTLAVHVGWSPVLRDRAGIELMREPWGTASQTTLVTADLPGMASTATSSATTGDEVRDEVTFTGEKRADWTLHWEACWLDADLTCPEEAEFPMGEPVTVDPEVDVYRTPAWEVEVPAGTPPGARLYLGWVPVVTDALGVELMREDWGVGAQTTVVDHPLPEMVSKATERGVVGAGTSQDRVVITGPVLVGSRLVWNACYSLQGDAGCRPDATVIEPGPVAGAEPGQEPDGGGEPGDGEPADEVGESDPQVGIVLPELAVGQTLQLDGPELALTDGDLPPHEGLQLSWMPQILTPEGEVLIAEPYGTPEQTTKVDFPPIETVTTAYAESSDGPWYGDWIGDRVRVTGEILPSDQVTVRLYAWPNDGPPVCEGEPLAEVDLDLVPGVSDYDTGLIYETPRDRTDLTYGFQETTVSRDTEVVSECGLAAETVKPQPRAAEDWAAAADDEASALAKTGAVRVLLMLVVAAVLAMTGGSITRWSEQRRTAGATG